MWLIKLTVLFRIIRKTFINLSTDTFLNLDKVLVRPQLKYDNAIWGPFTELIKLKIENVQRAAIRLVSSITHLSYEQRLRTLDLPSLKYRRLQGDMTNVYSLLHSIFNLDQVLFFTINYSLRIRGHTFKLLKEQIFKDVRANSFSQRVINSWNHLSTEVVTAPNLSTFKTNFDTFHKNIKFDL